MKTLDWLFGDAPPLTRKRIIAALLVAVIADAIQVALLPLAWTFAESAVDVVAMVIMVAILGFHPLLLPTFVIEILPVVDALPTWTACVSAVILLRKRAMANNRPTEITISEPPIEERDEPPKLPPPQK